MTQETRKVNPEDIDLKDIDLEASTAPRGIEVQIEGYAKSWKIDLPNYTLLAAICQAYCILSGNSIDSRALLPRITIKELDLNPPRIKVAIAKGK